MNKTIQAILSIGLLLGLAVVTLITLPVPPSQSPTVEIATVQTENSRMRRWKVYQPTTAAPTTTTTTIDPVWTTPPEEVPQPVGGPAEAEIGGCIRMYESGGTTDPDGSNSHADGYYQIIPSTWAGYKGYDIAQNAPRWIQDERFNQLWEENGHSHWAAQSGRCF